MKHRDLKNTIGAQLQQQPNHRHEPCLEFRLNWISYINHVYREAGFPKFHERSQGGGGVHVFTNVEHSPKVHVISEGKSTKIPGHGWPPKNV